MTTYEPCLQTRDGTFYLVGCIRPCDSEYVEMCAF